MSESRKVYLATAGEYSDYRVLHAFAREEDAAAYELADDVLELEVHEGPIEVRYWHTLRWIPHLGNRDGDATRGPNPWETHEPKDFNGRPKHVEHRWHKDHMGRDHLTVAGWDIDRVRKVYSEQRAQRIAREDMLGPDA